MISINLSNKLKVKGFTPTPKLVSGFTLVEIMVSVSVFIVIMTISSGSILSILDANRKSQNLRTVMDNLNFTLESMTRTIRFGTKYHCDVNNEPVELPLNCSDYGASSISVLSQTSSQVSYRLSGERIERKQNANPYSFLTDSNVKITSLKFYVKGSTPYSSGDLEQPRVIIFISGYVGAKPSTRSSFTIQTTVSQRSFDSQ